MHNREELLALLGAFSRLPAAKQAYLAACAETMAGLEPLWLSTPANRPQRKDLQVGEQVLVYPTFGGCPEPQLGKVSYIHPQKRFYVVALNRGCTQAFHWGEAD